MVMFLCVNLVVFIFFVMLGVIEIVEVIFWINNNFSGVSIINYGEIVFYDDMNVYFDGDFMFVNGSMQEDDDDMVVVFVEQFMLVFDFFLIK